MDGRPIEVPDAIPGGEDKESGLGDVVLRGEYYVRTGTSTSPWVIALLRVKLPTGDDEVDSAPVRQTSKPALAGSGGMAP